MPQAAREPTARGGFVLDTPRSMRQHRGVLTTDDLGRLCTVYAAARGLAIATVGRLAAGHGGFEKRLRAGRVTVRRIRSRRAVAFRPLAVRPGVARRHPPPDPPPPRLSAAANRRQRRPRPRRNGPAPRWRRPGAGCSPPPTAATGGRPGATSGRCWPPRWSSAPTAASPTPTALCCALGSPRHIYDDCVRRYAGHPERQPPPGQPHRPHGAGAAVGGGTAASCDRRAQAHDRQAALRVLDLDDERPAPLSRPPASAPAAVTAPAD